MSRCFIFGALPVSRLTEAPRESDLIIAADKGYDVALSLGLTPDLVVGDFDSRSEAPEVENLIRLQVRKDDTDVGHAVELGFERGYSDFVVYGAVGGLLDHTFANVVIAHDIARRGGKALFIGEEYSFTVLHNSEKELCPRGGGRISVFALGGTAKGVTIRGLSYETEDLTLRCTDHVGVSNAFIGKPASVSVDEGNLLVVWQTE
ncbi:MAG: thiamine diphosphokinase [Ruminococcus sp.]|nr:thiamine diphosphokinase [Ruminococcus sp.]